MTTSTFCNWLNSTLLPNFAGDHPNMPSSVSKCTAVRLLHYLGFENVDSKKGVYIDGHERKIYLKKHLVWASMHASPPPCSDDPPQQPSDKNKLVLSFNDESIFHSNDDLGWMWTKLL